MPRPLLAVVLALLGVGLLAHPAYLSLPSGQAVHPTFAPANASECTWTVAYADLPPRARHAFDVTSHGDVPRIDDTLYTGQHGAAVEAFRRHDCVSRAGSHYAVGLVHEDRVFPDPATLLGPLLFVSGFLALLGAAAVQRVE